MLAVGAAAHPLFFTFPSRLLAACLPTTAGVPIRATLATVSFAVNIAYVHQHADAVFFLLFTRS